MEQIGKELSENTVGCRARHFYRVMTENGLSPSIVADYGNWCRKGGSRPYRIPLISVVGTRSMLRAKLLDLRCCPQPGMRPLR